MKRMYFNQGDAGRSYSRLSLDTDSFKPTHVELEMIGEDGDKVDIQLNKDQVQNLYRALFSAARVMFGESTALWEDE